MDGHFRNGFLLYVLLSPRFLCGFGQECRLGWMAHENSCYLFSHDANSWQVAELTCMALGGYLTDITSASENNFIKQEIQKEGSLPDGHYWIGANDLEVEGVWKWIHSEHNISFNEWLQGQPNNRYNGENCGAVHLAGWNDHRCEMQYKYICEMPRGGQGSFTIVGR